MKGFSILQKSSFTISYSLVSYPGSPFFREEVGSYLFCRGFTKEFLNTLQKSSLTISYSLVSYPGSPLFREEVGSYLFCREFNEKVLHTPEE